jgi:hypothetical protein
MRDVGEEEEVAGVIGDICIGAKTLRKDSL